MALLWATGAWREELRQLLPWALPVPLRVHGRYSRAEVLAAFAIHDGRGARRSHREGVLWHQSSATATSATGQRFIHHATRGSRVLLIVREQRKQDGRPGYHRTVCVPRLCHLRKLRGRTADGDLLATRAPDPGGVAAGDGVGGLRGVAEQEATVDGT